MEQPAREYSGLTTQEVAQRIAAGQVNAAARRSARSTWDIMRSNLFTRFNAILAVLAGIIFYTGYWLDAMFATLIVVNSGVAIVQELRAKQTLDRLRIVVAARPRVRRDGVAISLAADEIVLDDLVELAAGDQVVVDGELVVAAGLEIDESLLTGEADLVGKNAGDPVLSGSFAVAGSGLYRAARVGAEAYAAKLEAEASKFSLVNSELRNGINQVLRVITWILIPAGALIVHNQLTSGQESALALRRMVAALVPMLPEGLVLMTTTAFAIGVIRLGRRNCLVNELPAIEVLARVDVVCADKTGTLTDNSPRFVEVVRVGDSGLVDSALAALAKADPNPNASLRAIAAAFPTNPGWLLESALPFSSERKFSGAQFAAQGSWLLGAPDVLLAGDSEVARQAQQISELGERVLLLATADKLPEGNALPELVPQALVVLGQNLRPDAQNTLQFFADEQVQLKVISGDNAASVRAVVQQLEVLEVDETIDARDLPPADQPEFAARVERGVVFGRVQPAQKRDMVLALQSRGHTVAMTGDGVNDVTALKAADIAVAMGTGSPASRAVAQVVLIDDKFANMVQLVAEGRRVIGNIERVAALFLTKTVYSVLLALLIGIPGFFSAAEFSYPFLPKHVTFVGWFTIGVPAFFLALAPSNERARPDFIKRVLRVAVPAGIVIGLSTFACYLIVWPQNTALAAEQVSASTSTLITLITMSLWVLAMVARPYVWWKVLLVGSMVAASAGLLLAPFTQRVFELDPSDAGRTLTALACAAVGIALLELYRWLVRGSVR